MPLLLGMRLVARRPRRAVLTAASIAVTVTGIVAVLAFHATAREARFGGSNGLINPVMQRDEQMLAVLTIVLVALSVLNAICATWATVLDAGSRPRCRAPWAPPAAGHRRSVRRAGHSRGAGCPAGGPAQGIGLFKLANHAGLTDRPAGGVAGRRGGGHALAVAVLAAVPARIGARRPVFEILQSETA